MVEADGLIHRWEETAEKDNQKANDPERAGFKVVRFTDEEVLKNMNAMIEAIQCVVEKEKRPPPSPPLAGVGGGRSITYA